MPGTRYMDTVRLSLISNLCIAFTLTLDQIEVYLSKEKINFMRALFPRLKEITRMSQYICYKILVCTA